MFIHRQHLFEARDGIYHHSRIPGLLVTPSGRLLATVEARRGNGGDWDQNDIRLRRSDDGGLAWTEPEVFVDANAYGEGPINNCVLFADHKENCIHALFCHNYATVYYMRSEDDGDTWTDPRDITDSFEALKEQYPWRVVAIGPGHGIQLENGRLLAAIWLSDGSGTEFGAGKLGHRPSVVATVASDDHGENWHCGDIVVRHAEGTENPSETVAVELNDGRVLLNIRTESERHRRLIATSPDGTSNWTTPAFDDELLEPICMGHIIRMPQKADNGKHWIAFCNPAATERIPYPGLKRPNIIRRNLTLRLSHDDCASWAHSKVIEPGPSGYCDLAVLDDGTLLILHEDQVVDGQCDDRYVTLVRCDLEYLTS